MKGWQVRGKGWGKGCRVKGWQVRGKGWGKGCRVKGWQVRGKGCRVKGWQVRGKGWGKGCKVKLLSFLLWFKSPILTNRACDNGRRPITITLGVENNFTLQHNTHFATLKYYPHNNPDNITAHQALE